MKNLLKKIFVYLIMFNGVIVAGPLHDAIRAASKSPKDIVEVENRLGSIINVTNINELDKHGMTPLHVAVSVGNIAAISAILDVRNKIITCGIQVPDCLTIRDSRGRTPKECVKISQILTLFEIKVKTSEGLQSYFSDAGSQSSSSNELSLHDVIIASAGKLFKDVDEAKNKLKEFESIINVNNIDARDNAGMTPLHVAVALENKMAICALLSFRLAEQVVLAEKIIDCSIIKDSQGRTPRECTENPIILTYFDQQLLFLQEQSREIIEQKKKFEAQLEEARLKPNNITDATSKKNNCIVQ